MSVNLLGFFRPSNLLDLRPASMSKEMATALIIFFGALIVASIVVKILQVIKKREHFLDKLFGQYFECLLVMGLVGGLWVWLRYEKVMFLSARFWLVLWLVGICIWLYFILKYQFKIVPQAQKHLEQKKIFNKYLPERKK